MPYARVEDRACKQCGVTALRFNRSFCSLRCVYEYRRAHPRSKNCEICGQRFFPPSPWIRTCGIKCGGLLRRKRKTLRCKGCGQDFTVPISAAARKWCSHKCFEAHHRAVIVTLKCAGCGKPFNRPQNQTHRSKGQFCSRACVGLRRGAKHPSWRGNRRHSRGTDWPEQAEKARMRDLHTCQVCGKPETKQQLLSVDHIVPFRMWPANALVNLLTVCRAPCHASKTVWAEPCILRGDKLGFLQRMNELGWPMELVNAAIEAWGRVPQLSFPILPRSPTFWKAKN